MSDIKQELVEKIPEMAGDFRFAIGEKFPIPGTGEGVSFSVEPFTTMLVLRLDRPTEDETEEFKKGQFELVITELHDVLFFISRFGRMHWMDCPYSTHLSERKKELPELVEGNRGYSIDCFLVDASNNLLKAHRLVRMTPAFSKVFKNLIDKDSAKDFNLNRFNREVNELYRAHSTKDLLSYRDAAMKEEKPDEPAVTEG